MVSTTSQPYTLVLTRQLQVFAVNADDAAFARFQQAAQGGGSGGTGPSNSGTLTPTSALSPATTSSSSTGHGFETAKVATGVVGLLAAISAVLTF
jgi:hypothetical protein